MRVVALDGGAERMGYAILSKTAEFNGSPVLHYQRSGLFGLHKPKTEKYQEYRIRLITYVNKAFVPIIHDARPDVLVTEVLPPNGFGSPFQAYLVNVALTTAQHIAIQNNIPVAQISARTVQTNIAVGKTKKITKVQVRNGVIQLFPELEERKSDWVKVFDEPDSIAVGAAYLGARNE